MSLLASSNITVVSLGSLIKIWSLLNSPVVSGTSRLRLTDEWRTSFFCFFFCLFASHDMILIKQPARGWVVPHSDSVLRLFCSICCLNKRQKGNRWIRAQVHNTEGSAPLSFIPFLSKNNICCINQPIGGCCFFMPDTRLYTSTFDL